MYNELVIKNTGTTDLVELVLIACTQGDQSETK